MKRPWQATCTALCGDEHLEALNHRAVLRSCSDILNGVVNRSVNKSMTPSIDEITRNESYSTGRNGSDGFQSRRREGS